MCAVLTILLLTVGGPLSGMPAGSVETPHTFHALVDARLRQLAQDIMAFGDSSRNGTTQPETPRTR